MRQHRGRDQKKNNDHAGHRQRGPSSAFLKWPCDAAAARAGDALLVSLLLAEEVDVEPDEIAVLEAAARDEDGTRFTYEEIRRELCL